MLFVVVCPDVGLFIAHFLLQVEGFLLRTKDGSIPSGLVLGLLVACYAEKRAISKGGG